MSSPVKEQIAQNLLTSLRAILRTGGYYTDAGRYVSRRRTPIATWSTSRGAELFLFSGNESGYAPCLGSTTIESTAEFVVVGYVSDQEPDRAVIELEADVKKAVLTDRTRGALAVGTEMRDLTTDYWEMVNETTAMLVLPFGVTYRWTVSSP